jgi:branched-chain amino acid transport system substrate-binding protein
MVMDRQNFFLLFVLFSLLLFSSAPTLAGPPLRIGVLLPLTGKYSEAGQAQKAAAEFMAEEINAAGGIKALGGAKIELVVADTTSEPAPIAGEMERLCAVEKVSVVLGPYATTESNSSAPIGERYGIPNISVQSTGDTLYPLKLKFWRTISVATSDVGRFYVSTLQKLIQEFKTKHERFALLYPNNDYGKICIGKAAKEELQKLGFKIVMDLPYDWRAADLSPVMLKLKGANPEVVIQAAYLADGIASHKARFATDLYPTMMGGITGYCNVKLWKLLGDEVARKTLQAGFFGASWYEETTPYKPLQDFLRKAKPWARAKGLEVDDAFVYGAQGMLAIKEAVEKAGSAEPRVINDALRRLSIPQGSPSLLLSMYDPALEWDDVGKPLNAILQLIQWNENKREIIYPKEHRTALPKLR